MCLKFRECCAACLVSFLVAGVQAQDFQLVVGGTSDPVRWPGGEDPAQAINQLGQKYLNFTRENTGFYVRPEGPNADEVATSITFWTANDAVPRDPASYRLFGSNSGDLLAPLDYLHRDQFSLDLFTEVSFGDLDLPDGRNAGGDADLDDANSQTIDFANSNVYENYLVLFPTVKDGGSANSMQIAEVQLNYDGFDVDSGIFDFEDEIAGVALIDLEAVDPVDPVDPVVPIDPLVVQEFKMIVGGTSDPVRWPAAEDPTQAINWEGQKYLNFSRENTGFYVQPEGPNADDVATSITFWTANDAVARDPASFRLLGSNHGELLSPLDYKHQDQIPLDSFTEIAFGDLALPNSRNAGGNAELNDANSQTVDFDNSAAFDAYVVVFPTVKDAGSANSMQIAEVQLNYDGFDIDSGILDFADEITGVALIDADAVPLDPVDPADPIGAIRVQNFEIVIGSTEDPVRWPGGEDPTQAINWEGQKYLNFTREDTGFLVRPEGPNADDVATSITFWTANDAVARDPASFRLLGSNSDDLLAPFDYQHEDQIPLDLFTEIAFGDLALPDSRNDGGVAPLDDTNSLTVDFENTAAFENYLVVFPTVKDGSSANSMQIAEVQLNYDGFDIGSGIFDFEDEITGIALVGVVSPCDPNAMGDLNGDGIVAFADFLVLSENFGEVVASHEQGDLDCNGIVGFADFLILSENFGDEVGAPTSSVPEPSGLVLLSISGMLLGGFRRRR